MKRPIAQQLLGLSLMASLIAFSVPALSAFAESAEGAKTPVAHSGKHFGKHGGKHKQEFMKQLNLTEEQKAQFKAAREKFKTEHAAEIESMKAKRQQLRELVKTKGKDDPQVQALRSELKQSWESMRGGMSETARSILTPEQYAKWQEMKAQHEQRHEKKMQEKQ